MPVPSTKLCLRGSSVLVKSLWDCTQHLSSAALPSGTSVLKTQKPTTLWWPFDSIKEQRDMCPPCCSSSYWYHQSHQSWCVLWLPPSVLLLFHTVIPIPPGTDLGWGKVVTVALSFLVKPAIAALLPSQQQPLFAKVAWKEQKYLPFLHVWPLSPQKFNGSLAEHVIHIFINAEFIQMWGDFHDDS